MGSTFVSLFVLSVQRQALVKLPGDTSVMTYTGHLVKHTLLRARFSPIATTGQVHTPLKCICVCDWRMLCTYWWTAFFNLIRCMCCFGEIGHKYYIWGSKKYRALSLSMCSQHLLYWCRSTSMLLVEREEWLVGFTMILPAFLNTSWHCVLYVQCMMYWLVK